MRHGIIIICDDVRCSPLWLRCSPLHTRLQDAAVAAFMSDWEPAHANLMRWLLDYLAQFVVLQRQNLMTSENMAIVWAPNLVTLDAVADPMQVSSCGTPRCSEARWSYLVWSCAMLYVPCCAACACHTVPALCLCACARAPRPSSEAAWCASS